MKKALCGSPLNARTAWNACITLLMKARLLLAYFRVFPCRWFMKTTVELPDELFSEVKVLATERRD
jgi:hypothetical protein